MFDFYRVASVIPVLELAHVKYNTKKIIQLIRQADDAHACLIVFPELSLTGYSCSDLFLQTKILNAVKEAIEEICSKTISCPIVAVLGMPIRHHHCLYNSAMVLQNGTIKGIIPKSILANYKEFYEQRWFTSGKDITDTTIEMHKKTVPFGTDILFTEEDSYFTMGVEICEDLWYPIPPSSSHTLAGATVIANLSASNEIIAKADYRRDLVRHQSARCVSAYVFSSSGLWESTADTVYSGHAMIAENGVILSESKRFNKENTMIYADIDCQRLVSIRLSETSMRQTSTLSSSYRMIVLNKLRKPRKLQRKIAPFPFVPADEKIRNERCSEVLHIQTAGLIKRLDHLQAASAIIGISGGLDSTLALWVVHEAFQQTNRDIKRLITVTMPGFGTSKKTYKNAISLCQYFKTHLRKIDITASCKQHFKDMGYIWDDDVKEPKSVTFENAQARERTQLLMDIANEECGIVIGTGDLSEIALGWTTFNGDHMSMYNVNCGVPKTLVKYIIQSIADHHNDNALKEILYSILDTPISPELLPISTDGSIQQKTEEIIGPYELHDFFLYHMIKYGAEPEKIIFLASTAFPHYTEEIITKWLRVFLRRFISQQFKRNCIPDGPKVGTISLSPRSDWRMPSDSEYLKEILTKE